jgi:hypothetical protein
VSSENFIASGFGVVDAVAVATSRRYAERSEALACPVGERRSGYTSTMTDHAPPSDETTLTDVLEGYARGGFTSSFVVTEDARLECVECGTVSDPEAVSMSSLRRLEGASDPDDMVAIVALTCPVCGSKGTVVLGYGPMATPQDADVLKSLRDDRGDSTAPGNSAHGETTGDDAPRE